MAAAAQSASALKDKGNGLFNAGQYQAAADAYTAALAAAGADAALRGSLRSNRAAARLGLGDAAGALEDADAAVAARPDWEKGHYRRGCALAMQGALQEALRAFDAALSLSPDSKEVLAQVKGLRQQIRSQQQRRRGQQEGRAGGLQRARPQAAAGEPGQGGMFQPPAPDAWAAGLPSDKRYEWLCDCYRMRIDDDYVWGGGNLHGLYAPDASADIVAEDFLVFCKMAVAHHVVPAGWDWARFLNAAARLLPFAFEKKDAKQKWGGENFFLALMGGRSLRATAETVLGSSCMAGGDADARTERLRDALEGRAGGRLGTLLGRGAGEGERREAAALLSDVGGPGAWRELLAALAGRVHGPRA